jgi:hypothetical protein
VDFTTAVARDADVASSASVGLAVCEERPITTTSRMTTTATPAPASMTARGEIPF